MRHQANLPRLIKSRISLGDSGFLHVRGNAILHVSEAQTHAFNTPYQLAVFPPINGHRPRSFREYLADPPEAAVSSTIEIDDGDVLIFATDGVWDNLAPQAALAVYRQVMKQSHTRQHSDGPARSATRLAPVTDPRRREDVSQAALATAIAAEARAASLNRRRDSPFSTQLRELYALDVTGGKVDDICVVVVIPVQNESKPVGE